MHFKRHATIARQVKLIKNYDKENALSQPKFERRKTQALQGEDDNVIEGSVTESPSISIASNDYGFNSKLDGLTKKQKKALRKTEKMVKQVREDLDSVTKEEIDHVSEAIHLKAHGGKSASFADFQNDEDLPFGEGICPKLVADNLFFTTHQRRKYYGKSMKKSEEEVAPTPTSALVPTPVKTPRHRYGTEPRPAFKGTPSSPEDPLDLVDVKIFERLGVPVTLGGDNSKKRRDFIKKLAVLIKEDLEIDQKELDDSRMRQAGFWRFVSSETLENLVELHKGFVWSTGELKNKEKYGENLKVTKQALTVEEEHIDLVGDNGAVKKVAADLEPEGVVEDTIGGRTPLTLKENILDEVKEEKRQKRLSSGEGFVVPKSKANARSKAKPQYLNSMNPKSPPLARNVLRIVGTTNAKPRPFNPVPLKRALPVKKPQKKSTAAGFYGSLGGDVPL